MAPPALERILKDNPKVSRTDLEYLQDWLSKQPHLPSMTDVELVPFLHINNYSLERAKQRIDKYFSMRTQAPEIAAFRDPAADPYRAQIDLFHFAPAGRCSDGSLAACSWIQDADTGRFDMAWGVAVLLQTAEVLVRDDPTATYTVVLDARKLSMGHLTKMPPSLVRKTVMLLQDGVPLRFAAIHVINVTSIVDTLMAIVRPFLAKEIQKLLHFHTGSMDSFYETVPKEVLPHELGGTFGSGADIHREKMAHVEANAAWLRTLERRVADESKRPDGAKSAGDVFGMEGSFKRLDID